MRRLMVLGCLLSGLFLAGCDSLAARYIHVVAETSYQPAETSMALRHDFDAATQILSDYTRAEGFSALVAEWEPWQRVYYKDLSCRGLRLEVAASPEHNAIAIGVIEMMPTARPKPSEVLGRTYTALVDRLRAEFGDRVETDEGDGGSSRNSGSAWIGPSSFRESGVRHVEQTGPS